MNYRITEAEIDQLADLARGAGTHYQLRVKQPATDRQSAALKFKLLREQLLATFKK